MPRRDLIIIQQILTDKHPEREILFAEWRKKNPDKKKHFFDREVYEAGLIYMGNPFLKWVFLHFL